MSKYNYDTRVRTWAYDFYGAISKHFGRKVKKTNLALPVQRARSNRGAMAGRVEEPTPSCPLGFLGTGETRGTTLVQPDNVRHESSTCTD